MVEGGNWPPGWYPDPTERAPFRWWDGTNWTEGLSDDMVRAWPDPAWVAPVAGAPAAPPPEPSGDAAPRPAAAKPWYSRPEARWLAGGLLVVSVLFAIVSANEDPEATQDVSAGSAATTSTVRSTTTERIVTTTAAATTTTTAPPTTTTTTAPPTTTTAAPTTTSPPTTAPPPPPTTAAPVPLASGNCHPSYDPCVPFASDVDCLGGKGNGPAYTGRVTVIGYDEYDLDADGDGIGCDNS